MFKTCAKELTKWRERLATKRENKKAATARACQADNMKPRSEQSTTDGKGHQWCSVLTSDQTSTFPVVLMSTQGQ